jgi:glutamine synthetase adenylyltransferase
MRTPSNRWSGRPPSALTSSTTCADAPPGRRAHPGRKRDREVKLGPGGLRDVEFAVQLLQLVHGRGDPNLRLKGTLPALDALRAGGYVGRDDAVSLADAYRFLRSTEHRLQLYQLRRTHLVPSPDRRGSGWRGRWLPARFAG